VIHIIIAGLPISTNHAYFQRGKKRILTTAGRRYKTETTTLLQTDFRQQMMFFKKNLRYQLFFRFHIEGIQNKLWSNATSKVNRYKKFDGGNLCKLFEDCLADAGGIDDSQTMRSIWEKKEGTPERTEIWAWCLDEEHDPFDFDFTLENLR
jgi:Holliday junction resolvase RusA-like endonuclease